MGRKMKKKTGIRDKKGAKRQIEESVASDFEARDRQAMAEDPRGGRGGGKYVTFSDVPQDRWDRIFLTGEKK